MTATAKLGWYARRLGRMSPAEIAWRAREQAIRRAWARRQVRPGQIAPPPRRRRRRIGDSPRSCPRAPPQRVPAEAREAIVADADRLLKGEWEMLGVVRTDMEQPDWFYDPVTGRRSAPDAYAFQINQRSEEQTGNVKQVWELSRLQHLTLLATAWFLTHEEGYAQRVADQLRSWWLENPFLSGVNWTSGIEVGIRLINFVWIRRLLDGWAGAADLFEHSDLALRQVHWHQQYLAAFESRGSSANNHVIAEAAGQLAASCAFPVVQRKRPVAGQLGAAARSASWPATPFLPGSTASWPRTITASWPSSVSSPRSRLTPRAHRSAPRRGGCCARWRTAWRPSSTNGCSRPGRAIPTKGAWCSLTHPCTIAGQRCSRSVTRSSGGSTGGRTPPPDAGSVLVSALSGSKREIPGRPGQRPSRFEDAGITILRTARGDSPEIWCRCDGGPHGFLSIAAHAHADALSVEVRYGGVDILADPGTYCYHGEPEWRKYFQSTIGHNTLEVDGRWQSVRGGPFLWLRHATRTRDLGD